MRALLIGESWGIHENEYRHAFVGYSGQENARMGGEAGLFPPLIKICKHCKKSTQFGRCEFCGTFNGVSYLEMVHFWAKVRTSGIGVTNVFAEHPKDDNVELFFGGRGDDICVDFLPYKRGAKNLWLLSKHKHHLERLFDEITTLKPNILIPMGNTACWAVLNQTKIRDLRGTIHQTKFGIKALPTYHPAALRDWSLRPLIVADLKKAVQNAESATIVRNPAWFLTDPTLDDIEGWFSVSSPRYSCDIESAYILYSKAELGQMKLYAPKARNILAQLISIVGFARSESEAIAIPFFVRNKTSGELESYWPTPSCTVRAWQWVQYGLSSGAELVFQNGLYDLNRLISCGMRPKNMIHDTMLRQHSMFPEMLKGLGFLNSLYGDGGDMEWKSMYSKGETLKRDD